MKEHSPRSVHISPLLHMLEQVVVVVVGFGLVFLDGVLVGFFF